jgi:hypothetical protein
MRQPSTGREHAGLPVREAGTAAAGIVSNPAVLWRRTASSVVVLPPGGEPTELTGSAAAVWDAVTRPETGLRSVDELDALEVDQIVGALVHLELVLPS